MDSFELPTCTNTAPKETNCDYRDGGHLYLVSLVLEYFYITYPINLENEQFASLRPTCIILGLSQHIICFVQPHIKEKHNL